MTLRCAAICDKVLGRAVIKLCKLVHFAEVFELRLRIGFSAFNGIRIRKLNVRFVETSFIF